MFLVLVLYFLNVPTGFILEWLKIGKEGSFKWVVLVLVSCASLFYALTSSIRADLELSKWYESGVWVLTS